MYRNKSCKRILVAFRDLLLVKDYCEISVLEIISKADVSKSTFYRYYNGKLCVFIEMHKLLFQKLFTQMNTKDAWLSCLPQQSFINMASLASRRNGIGRSMVYKMGDDWSIASRLIRDCLSSEVENQLLKVFGKDSWIIPIEQVAGSIAALHIDCITQLGLKSGPSSAEQELSYLQFFTQSIINSSLS
ncbi:TPA: TetR/AcrR family transcriptional regulator [Vibrio parahaemolyticus]|nr:TetR/AcrR family transcriptional regulator [Vibrio parahaemolyticus]